MNRKNLERLFRGRIDVAIGTHRLLSHDVQTPKLGLLIIDEEQRFGVRQKERIVMIKKDIDVLFLSATPIPRTLQAALSGLRSISRLDSPPLGRQAIETRIARFSPALIKDAVTKEG